MGLTAIDIMNDAALLLNDSNRTTFNYNTQTPWLKKAIDAFSDELAVNNIQFLEKRTVISPTIIGSTTTIPLPVDALLPNHLEERAYGSTDAWVGMVEADSIDPNLTPENSFRIWAFQGTLLNSVPVIDVPNASSAREVRVTYTRFLTTLGVDSTTDFSTSLTFQSKRYISAKTAEYITRFILKDDKRGKELKQESEEARYRIIQIWTKKRQNQPIRKSRYGSPSTIQYPTVGSGGGSSSATTSAITTPPYDYYVRDYGAVGDGLTDDTTKIQAAINAALATGGKVIFDPKTYLVSATLTLPLGSGTSKPVFLVGYGKYNNLQVAGVPGTSIKWVGTTAAGIVISFIGRNSCTIDGISIDCGLTTGSLIAADVGLYVESSIDCNFRSINIFRAAQWGIKLRANTAGVYRCTFFDITTDLSCNGGMLHESLNINADIAQCTFNRVDIVYSGPNAGLDLKATDNCLFLGLVVIASNGATCGPLINLRDVAAPNFGCFHNVFVQLDGGTTTGTQKGILCNATSPNICYGLDFANGLLIDTASAEADKFLFTDTAGVSQTNLLQLVEGRAFGTSSVLSQFYFDSSALKTRFQNHDAATRRGWIYSGNAGAGAEVTAFEIDPDGRLFQVARDTPIGEYKTPAHVPGNYTATAGTWTVVAGTTKVSYERAGNKVTFHIEITGSSVSNAGVVLQLTMFGFVAVAGKGDFYFPIRIVDAGGVATTGMAKVTAGAGIIQFFSNMGGGGFGIAVANTTIQAGAIVIEVQ